MLSLHGLSWDCRVVITSEEEDDEEKRWKKVLSSSKLYNPQIKTINELI
jgi:hypothetical protein